MAEINDTSVLNANAGMSIYDVNFNLMQFASVYNDFIDTVNPKTMILQRIVNKEILSVEIENVASIKNKLKSDIDKEKQDRIEADNEIKKTIEEKTEEFDAKIAAEAKKRIDQDVILDNKIDTEISRAKDAENTLDTKIINESNRALEAEKDLNDKISAEASRAKSVENQLRTDLDAETLRAKTTEDQLRSDLDAEVLRAKSEESKLDSKIEDEITRATSVENELRSDLDTTMDKLDQEIDRAKKADGSLVFNDTIKNDDGSTPDNLTDAINDVDERYEHITSSLIQDLSFESKFRQEEDEKLQEEISNEIARAKDAEGPLKFNDDIRNEDGTLATDLTNAINIVDDRLNNTTKALKDKDEKILEYIDAQIEKIINGSPEALDTLKELADALGDDPQFATTILDKISKLNSKIGNLDELNTDDKSSLVKALIEVQLEINNEAKIRVAADNTLNTKILNEEARAKDAEKDLDYKIEKEIDRAINEDKILDDKIDEEIIRAKEAEGTLVFEENIRNHDGTKPDNLTDAINAVNKTCFERIDQAFDALDNFGSFIDTLDSSEPSIDIDFLKIEIKKLF